MREIPRIGGRITRRPHSARGETLRRRPLLALFELSGLLLVRFDQGRRARAGTVHGFHAFLDPRGYVRKQPPVADPRLLPLPRDIRAALVNVGTEAGSNSGPAGALADRQSAAELP